MKNDAHFSRQRVEEQARTADAVRRSRIAAGAGQAAIQASRDLLGTPNAGKTIC